MTIKLKYNKYELLLSEFNRVNAEIVNRTIENYKAVGLLLAIFGGVFALGNLLKNDLSIPFLLLPYLMSYIYAAYINETHKIVQLEEYRRYLENKINNVYQEDILIWEKIFTPKKYHVLLHIIMYLSCLVIFTTSIIIGIYCSKDIFSSILLTLLYSISLIIIFILLFYISIRGYRLIKPLRKTLDSMIYKH